MEQQVKQSTDQLSISEFASLFGFPADAILAAVEAQRRRASERQSFFTISQLSARWQCSRGTVYNLLQSAGVNVLNVGQGKKRRKTLVPADAVAKLERIRSGKMS